MSSAISSPGQTQTAPNRWLWAAVGALAATTLAMGVALVQMRSAPPAPATVAPVQVSTAPVPMDAAKPVLEQAGAAASSIPMQKASAAPVKHAQIATKKIANGTQEHKAPVAVPVAPMAPAPTVADTPPAQATAQMQPPPLKAVCAHCGTVEAVTAIERDGPAGGGGVVAGAVLGGLLGNQVGGGNGKTIATILGAVGGGWAGNTVEKRMKKVTVYQVDVRMDDASTRRVEHHSPLSVGAEASVNDGVISQ